MGMGGKPSSLPKFTSKSLGSNSDSFSSDHSSRTTISSSWIFLWNRYAILSEVSWLNRSWAYSRLYRWAISKVSSRET